MASTRGKFDKYRRDDDDRRSALRSSYALLPDTIYNKDNCFDDSELGLRNNRYHNTSEIPIVNNYVDVESVLQNRHIPLNDYSNIDIYNKDTLNFLEAQTKKSTRMCKNLNSRSNTRLINAPPKRVTEKLMFDRWNKYPLYNPYAWSVDSYLRIGTETRNQYKDAYGKINNYKRN